MEEQESSRLLEARGRGYLYTENRCRKIWRFLEINFVVVIPLENELDKVMLELKTLVALISSIPSQIRTARRI